MSNKKHMPPCPPSDVDWARLAAYIDGEGCVYLNLHREFYPHLDRYFERFYLRIVITNTDLRLAEWLSNTFGGTVYIEKRKNPKWRNCARWDASCKHAADLLAGCYSYLIIKKEQADVALAFQRTVTRKTGRKGHSDDVNKLRAKLRQDLHALHNTYKPCRAPDSKQNSDDVVIN